MRLLSLRPIPRHHGGDETVVRRGVDDAVDVGEAG